MAKRRNAFGLRIDEAVYDNNGTFIASYASPLNHALINVRLNSKGIEGLYMNGVNLARPIMFNATNGDSTVWSLVGGAALAALGAAQGTHTQKLTTNTTTSTNATTAASSSQPSSSSEPSASSQPASDPANAGIY